MKTRDHRNEPMERADALERTLLRLAGGRLGWLARGAMAGALSLSTVPALTGCDEGGEGGPAPADGVPGLRPEAGKADWAHAEGRRDASMVSYLGGYWHEYRDCNNRGGCQGVDVFLKVRVKPAEGANLDTKRVGVVYRLLDEPDERTATGTYYATWDNGEEEWHVRVSMRAWEAAPFVFNTWYQDGRGNTFYDDNNGELHAVAFHGSFAVLRQDWAETRVHVGEAGVQGTISLHVADLDYDKDLRLVWTTDGWQTVNEMAIGAAGDKNELYWVEDLWSGHERWAVDLDLAGPAEVFEYAVVYRHGVVNGARPYEFWDNNGGQNHRVVRAETN